MAGSVWVQLARFAEADPFLRAALLSSVGKDNLAHVLRLALLSGVPYFTTAAAASGVSMVVFSSPTTPPTDAFPAILANGILVNGFSYVAWIAALKRTEASRLAPLVFLSPVLAAILLVVFFGEPFLPATAIGLVLVIAAGLLGTRN